MVVSCLPVLIMVGITAWELFIRRKFYTGVRLFHARFGFGFSLFWTAAALVGTFSDYHQLSSELREGRCDIVEGIVTDFHPMPFFPLGNESFAVEGQQFSYNGFAVTPGFNNTRTYGGPIHDGLHVRIYYVDKDIARLDIAN